LALFRSDYADGGDELRFGQVCLRPPQIADYDQWLRLRANSQNFLHPWEPKWAKDELTHSAYKRRVRRHHEDRLRSLAYAFLVFRTCDDQLVGGCNLSNVRLGVAQSASLGYWVGKPFQRQGYTHDAVEAVANFCFDELRLHRLEAACLPHNLASRKLLEKCNFKEEGLAREYLKINDIWADHVLFARITTKR